MLIRDFQKFANHDVVRCFSCSRDLQAQDYRDAGYPPGRGRYVKFCPDCAMSTFYDLKRNAYTVQAYCTGMGWVDTRHGSDTWEIAYQKEKELLANDAAWMPGERQTRIVAS